MARTRRLHRPSAVASLPALAVPAIAMVALSACARATTGPSPSRTGVPATAGTVASGLTRTPQSDDAVIERLSTARCEREESCHNVGDGQKYASKNACIDRVREGIATDVSPRRCSRGVDGAELERCAAAIEFERCDHAPGAAAALDPCRAGALCVK
jgi:hypothetical protein